MAALPLHQLIYFTTTTTIQQHQHQYQHQYQHQHQQSQQKHQQKHSQSSIIQSNNNNNNNSNILKGKRIITHLHASPPDLEVVALVTGQENYGFAIVAMGEAVWSFLEAPSLDHAKVLIPATLSAIILIAVSGPMITSASASASSITLGLEIATGVSIVMGASYMARLLAPYSPSAKEIAFGGLLVSIAAFFSFSQNLIVDGFVTLPNIPLPPLPSFPANTFDSE
mmetsp:Transcript_7540/g.10789  ORF Transcript_7540/g.10789 Transcript_7540/m.10789 type:complete len:225 (-) Transcript_7540:72-746(-)